MNPRLRWKTQAFAAIVILSNAFGNLSLTWGLRNGVGELTSPLSFLRAIFSPWVSLGICLLITWMLSRMFLLSWADLSYVLPVTAFGYVLNAVLGRVFLGEQVTPARWAGTLLIMAGVVLVGLGNPKTGDST
ncbi:MAG: EamA family transporter [Acidobacteriia bacterium]|nr:EamA family transporter [Terriglobia bacterium]